MKAIRFQALLVAASVASALGFVASAQAQTGPALRHNSNNGPSVVQHHASTLEEGILRGTGDLLRGIGSMNESNSIAMINGQEAARRAIENRRAYVQMWHDVRRINREARAQNKKPRVSNDALARIARDRAPKSLSANDYNPATGGLVWPVALQGDEFASYRDAVDSLLAETKGSRAVRVLAGDMSVLLKEQVKYTPSNEYVAAKNFLTGLSNHDGSTPATLAAK